MQIQKINRLTNCSVNFRGCNNFQISNYDRKTQLQKLTTYVAQTSAPTVSVEQEIREELRVLLQDIKSTFVNVKQELSEWISDDMIIGEVPKDIEGTLFRNGPALFERNGVWLDQPFDGDGMVTKFSIKDGKIHYMNKFVRTEGYVAEEKAGRFTYKGVFSSGNPNGSILNNPFDLKFKNVANTGIFYWGGKLFALHEAGAPHEIDPITLETIGLSNVFNTIEGDNPFTAHYRVISEKNNQKRWITFQSQVQGLDNKITFFEFAENGVLIHKIDYIVPGGMLGFFHDMLVTENYYILHENPTELNFGGLLTDYVFGRCCLAELIEFKKERPGRFHVIPRPGKLGQGAKIFDVPANFIFHHSNAYEVNDGKEIILDVVSMDNVDFGMNYRGLSPDYYTSDCRPNLKRLILDLQKQEVVDNLQLILNSCEFPSINWDYVAKPNKITYVACDKPRALPNYWAPNQGVSKVTTSEINSTSTLSDLQVEQECWFADERSIVEEPLFIPRNNQSQQEDDGYIALMVQTPHQFKSQLVFLDAKNIQQGPVAKVTLPFPVAPGLHGSWCKNYFGP